MGKCKFNSGWLAKKDNHGRIISTWAKQTNDNTKLNCILCKKIFTISKGLQSINQHVQTKLHEKNEGLHLNNQQLRISLVHADNITEIERELQPVINETRNLSLYSSRDSALRAELIWCLKNVSSNMSAYSTKGITDVFKAMFQTLPEGFSLSPTKLRYLITEALGPYFRKQLLEDLANTYYTIQYDETTNSESTKELQIAIRFYSEKEQKVCTRHLETFFLGSATAEILKQKLVESLDNAGLPLRKLLMVASDGPNVNKKVFRLLNEDIKNLGRKPLIDIGTCSIHIVHNAFLKGFESFGTEISHFIIAVHYFFDNWPLRVEDFKTIQNDCNLPNHKFLKHVNSRWLTIGPAISRILEQYSAIKKYFLEFIPKQRKSLCTTKHYLDIVGPLTNNTFVAELHFVQFCTEMFTKYTAFFQKEEPLIHLLYSELKMLTTSVLLKVLKKETVIDFDRVLCMNKDFYNGSNLLPIMSIKCGERAHNEILKLNEKDQLKFFKRCQTFYIESSWHLLSKSPLTLKGVKYFAWLNPQNLHNTTDRYVGKVCDILPDINKDVVCDEFLTFQIEILKKESANNVGNTKENINIDDFWASVDKEKYPNLLNMTRMCLSLAHGSASVERGFSLSGRILTEDKTHTSLRTLNSRLNIHNILKRYNYRPELIPITKELLSLGRVAYISYKNYLENKSIAAAKEEAEKKHREEEMKEEKMKLEKYEKEKETINLLENKLKSKSKEKQDEQIIVTKLINESNKKLKRALQKNDMAEANVAQTMLEGLLERRKKEEKKSKEVDSLQKTILKRKSMALNNFTLKKSKI